MVHSFRALLEKKCLDNKGNIFLSTALINHLAHQVECLNIWWDCGAICQYSDHYKGTWERGMTGLHYFCTVFWPIGGTAHNKGWRIVPCSENTHAARCYSFLPFVQLAALLLMNAADRNIILWDIKQRAKTIIHHQTNWAGGVLSSRASVKWGERPPVDFPECYEHIFSLAQKTGCN